MSNSRIAVRVAVLTTAIAIVSMVSLAHEPALAAHVEPVVIANVPAGFQFPEGLVADPVANRVYVIGGPCCNTTNPVGRVSVMNGATNTVLATIPVSGGALYGALNPITNRLYVTNGNGGPNIVTVIDTTSNTVLTTIPVGASPWGIAVNPTTNRVYVVNTGGNSVSVIDGATNAVTAQIALANPRAVTVNPLTNRIYVALSSRVAVIDGATNTVIASPPIQSGFFGIGLNPVTNRLYVPNFLHASVSVIDTLSNTTIATIQVGAQPNGAGVNPTTNHVYVANRASNNVSIIDGDTSSVVRTIGVGSVPFDVATNPVTDRVYVSNVLSHTVSVIADLTPEDLLEAVAAELEALINANPGTPLADKLEDALTSVQAAIAKLDQTPPDRQAAMGEIEGAVGDLEAAVKDGLLSTSQGNNLMNRLARAARLLAQTAIDEAIARSGDPGKINEAEQALADGDAHRTAGAFKNAVNRYKDALAKAEGA